MRTHFDGTIAYLNRWTPDGRIIDRLDHATYPIPVRATGFNDPDLEGSLIGSITHLTEHLATSQHWRELRAEGHLISLMKKGTRYGCGIELGRTTARLENPKPQLRPGRERGIHLTGTLVGLVIYLDSNTTPAWPDAHILIGDPQ